MRILHFADLHLGKSLSGFSLKEDQEYILEQILDIARHERVEALLLAGDVFDRANPPQEAMEIFDRFISRLAQDKLKLFLVSGNHDSASRLGYGSKLFAQQGIHLATQPLAGLSCFELGEGKERLDLYLLPYTRSYDLRALLASREDQDFSQASYPDLMKSYLAPYIAGIKARQEVGIPSLLLAHLWLVEAGQDSLLSESELPSLGMVDQLPASLFAAFNYVALGHLHRPQEVNPKMVYPGSPLAYAGAEADQQKRVIILDIAEGEISWREKELEALYAVSKIRGSFQDLLTKPGTDPENYVFVELSDQQPIGDAALRLQTVYPKLCEISFPGYAQAAKDAHMTAGQTYADHDLADLFASFFRQETGHDLNVSQQSVVAEVLGGLQVP